MTFIHFVNLSALTLIPQLIAQKALMSEYGLDYGLSGLTAGLYLLSALVKLLLEDAVVPASGGLIALVLRCLLSLIDAAAIGFAISRRRSLFAAATTAGFAWALTDAFSRRLLVFFFKAWGPEYSSEHLDSAIVSQFALALALSVALLVALFLKKAEMRAALAPWIILGVSVQPIIDYLSGSSGLFGSFLGIPFVPLLAGAGLTFVVAQRARGLYLADAKRQ